MSSTACYQCAYGNCKDCAGKPCTCSMHSPSKDPIIKMAKKVTVTFEEKQRFVQRYLLTQRVKKEIPWYFNSLGEIKSEYINKPCICGSKKKFKKCHMLEFNTGR